jgi:CheY-like chemotaxis protein
MSRKKLLVADDSLTIQKVIRLALSNEGYDIQAVSNGAEALEQLSMFSPDVLLVDVSLPTKDAFDLKHEINSQPDLNRINTILMSSAFEKFDEARANEVGFEGRLVKPFDPAHLRSVLQEVLSGPEGAEEAPTPPDLSESLSPPSDPGSASAPPSPPPTAPPVSLDDFSSSGGSAYEASGPVDIPVQPPAHSPSEPNQPIATESPPVEDELWTDQTDSTDPHISRVAAPTPTPSEPEETSAPPVSADFAPSAGSETTNLTARPKGSEEDIRELTESTMRMTGMDDFEWAVSEKGATPPPAPPSVKKEETLSEMGEKTLAGIRGYEPSLAPPQEFAKPGPEEDDENSGDIEVPTLGMQNTEIDSSSMNRERLNAPTEDELKLVEPGPEERSFSAQAVSAPRVPQADSSTNAVDSTALEALVREQVRKSIQDMAQGLLPDIAERIIKEEIHRMLNQPPEA